VKADQVTSVEMKAKISLAEERANMQVEDCKSWVAREILKYRQADHENKKFKAELLRQKDEWARGLEEKQRQLDFLID